jgi:hypothetical protein
LIEGNEAIYGRDAGIAPAGAMERERVTVVDGLLVLTASYTQPRVGASGAALRVT